MRCSRRWDCRTARRAISGERERAAEAEALRLGVAEIEAAAPVAGEDATLLAEDERLSNADGLHAAAAAAHEALAGDPAASAVDASDALTLIGIAGRALEPVRSHDPVLAGLAGRLSEASYLLSDLAADLASYTESLDSDPARLAAVQERRATLGRLVRAYGGPSADVAGVLDWAKQAGARLGELEGDTDKITALADEEAELGTQVGSLAADLTALRSAAAERFDGGHGRANRAGHAARVADRGADRAGRARPAWRRRRGDQAGRASRRAAAAAAQGRLGGDLPGFSRVL